MKRNYSWVVVAALVIVSSSTLILLHPITTGAQQYPIMDRVAQKVILKYQQSSCEQLWEKKATKAPPTAEEQQVITFLRGDPQIRAAFIAKIAPPIANKMFDCGLIP